MLNLNTEDINSISNTIGTLIFFIIIIIGIFIIIDEIFNLSKFCFKYTYLYNYGKLNENICKNDIIEFETARYRIHNELNKYKLEKDLFNKNWFNYVVFISILLLSILMCFAFGYIFYHLFIFNNFDCNFDTANLSFFNKILKCLGHTNYIPNCSFNYFILFSIIIIYPLIFISKFLFNIDYSYDNNDTYTKLFHLFILISLFYYIYILIYIKNDDNDYLNLTKIGIFICFIIVFLVINFIFNKSYNDYYNINKGTNIYSRDKTLINILNKYFHFAKVDDVNFNDDDFRDINFFEIYKQEEPIKPTPIEKPIELENFKFCNETDFSNTSNLYCNRYNNKKEEYKQIKNKINDYYINKKQYEKDLNIYNLKYNIYKNNKIEFPDFVSILNYLLPNLLGVNNITHIILFVCLLIFLFYYNFLKTNNKLKEANYIYNTIIIYIISLLSILILSNSILTYNTYINKYLIYEPIAYYKEELFNINVLFNILLNKDTNKTISNNYIDIYNYISSKKLTSFNSDENTTNNFNEIIKKFDEKIVNIAEISNVVNNNDATLNNIRKTILNIIISDLIKVDKDTNIFFNSELKINPSIHLYKTFFFNSIYKYTTYLLNTENLITYNDSFGNKIIDFKTFFLIIKNIFVEDKKDFDKHIQKLKNNLKYIIYKDNNRFVQDFTSSTDPNDNNYYNNFLIDDVSNEKLLEIDTTLNNTNTKLYLYNLNYINDIFDYYKNFLEEFRILIIELFNSTEVNCNNNDDVININSKLITYLNKIIYNNIGDPRINKFVLTETNYIFKDNNNQDPKKKEANIGIYKKILEATIDKLNTMFRKYLNKIKTIYNLKFDTTEETSSNNLEKNIISNYNFFNKETKKHLSQNLLKKSININKDDINKYDNYDSERLLKLNLSINNVGWSFVIIMIIIAIFLMEPIIIQS
jgi:hypothetical protein